ncbi:hypothetical protein D3C73_780480 [compost metagenome]
MNSIPPSTPAKQRDILFLLIQNPTTLYAYWRLSSRKERLIKEHFGDDWRALRPTLRLYDITGLSFDGSASGPVRQYSVDTAYSCYLQELEPAKSYAADLGIWNKRDQFLPLLRSNTVYTPRTSSGSLVSDIPLSTTSSLQIVLPIEYEQFSAYTLYPKVKKEEN